MSASAHIRSGWIALFDAIVLNRLEMKMETHPYNYDTTLPWIPQQNQVYEGGGVTPQFSQQQLPRPQNQGVPPRSAGQKPKAPEKMPRSRALALANTLKRWLAVASIVGFGTIGGLAAFHQVNTATSQSTQSSSGSSNTSSTSSSSSQNSNNFLKQQGGNTSGTSNSSTSSSSTSSSSSTPVTGTSTS
jgi:cytoskeletal protein RodZ